MEQDCRDGKEAGRGQGPVIADAQEPASTTLIGGFEERGTGKRQAEGMAYTSLQSLLGDRVEQENESLG